MIYIKDDFLPKNLLNAIIKDKSDYEEHKTPGKSFWIKKPGDMFIEYIEGRLTEIEGIKAKSILCFFRQAKENQDNEWRIHNDSIIEGEQPDRALVLFVSDEKHKGLNGTAFCLTINMGTHT